MQWILENCSINHVGKTRIYCRLKSCGRGSGGLLQQFGQKYLLSKWFNFKYVSNTFCAFLFALVWKIAFGILKWQTFEINERNSNLSFICWFIYSIRNWQNIFDPNVYCYYRHGFAVTPMSHLPDEHSLQPTTFLFTWWTSPIYRQMKWKSLNFTLFW